MSKRRPVKFYGPHAVWIKIPMMDAEVRSRHMTAKAAENAAAKLRHKWRRGTEWGKVHVWVESPGSIEELTRRMSDEYEEGR